MTSIDPNNHVSVNFIDALGRIVYVQYDSGGGANNAALTPNELKIIQYNPIGSPTKITADDLAPQTNQVVTSVSSTAQYDDLGRATSTTDPDRGTFTYTYDADGRVFSSTSGTRTIGINYDLMGRVGCVQDAAPTINATGACSNGKHLIQNTYDVTAPGVTWGSTDYPIGRLTQSVATTYNLDTPTTSATTTQSVQYDQRGRVITQQMQVSLPSSWGVTTNVPTYQMALGYNDANQPTTMTTSKLNPNSSGYTISQVYDSTTGVLTGLSNNLTAIANVASLSYNSNGLVSDLNFFTSTDGSTPTLANEHFTYDGNLRPSESTATWLSGSGTSGQIFDQSRWYDPASNVISLSTTLAAVPNQANSGGSEVQNFCYDEQNRLLWAGNSGTMPGAGSGTCGSQTLSTSLNGAAYTNTFVYTHLGQLWQAPVNGAGSTRQYLYCDSTHPHQLTGAYPSGTTCGSLSGALYTSSYDGWGNVTGRTLTNTTATLSYDNLNHLTRWNDNANNTEYYLYDAAGNRVLRRSTSGGTTTMTVYAFGVEEHTYSGSGTSQSNTYYYSLGGRLIGELTGGKTSIFITDALGSVLATFSNTAGSAAVLGNHVYGPYGKQRYASSGTGASTMGTNKGFTGQYHDSVTGLGYFNARYYDPAVGIFLSAESVQGNPQGMNPYAYVGGNPETMNDPTGQASCDLACQAGGTTKGGSGGCDLACQAGGTTYGGGTGTNPGSGMGCGKCGTDTNAPQPSGCSLLSCKMATLVGQDVYQPIDTSSSLGGLQQCLASWGMCINVPFQVKATTYYKTTVVGTVETCTLTFVCLEDGSDESDGDQQTNNSDRGLLNKAEDNAAEMNAAGEAGKGTDPGAANEAPNETTTVYRVQGGGSKPRLTPDPNTGKFNIEGDSALFLNFDNWDRAIDFLDKRGIDSEIVTFEVENEFVDAMASEKVSEWEAKNKDNPFSVDTAFPGQYGLRKGWFSWLKEYTVSGSFKSALTWDEYSALSSVGVDVYAELNL